MGYGSIVHEWTMVWKVNLMPRVLKYRHEWVVQGNYGSRWEDVTAADDWRGAKSYLRDYDVNETQYPHRVVHRRIRIEPEKHLIPRVELFRSGRKKYHW